MHVLDVVLSEMGCQRQSVRDHGEPRLERTARGSSYRRLGFNPIDPFSAGGHQSQL
jgi:hypothetical protein